MRLGKWFYGFREMSFHVHITLIYLFVLLIGNSASATGLSSKTGSEERAPQQKLKISNVGVTAVKFNPSTGERVDIQFSLSANAQVTLRIFDADFELVKTLLEKENKKAGAHRVAWNGRDRDGAVVPDEAYFFTIEATDAAGRTDVYDPIIFSGGETYAVAQIDFDKERNTLRYRLGHAGRVLIRMGTFRGPLLRTLVDWEPRPAGLRAEDWDGKDASGMVRLRDQPGFVASVTYFTLPENALIAAGNTSVSYYAYKAGQKTKRPKKEDRGRKLVSDRPIAPQAAEPRSAYQTPKIHVTFPGVTQVTPEGWPVLDGAAVVRVAVDEKNKPLVENRKTEAYLFLDNRFLLEAETPQPSYDLRWDFSQTTEGEHVLTVNFLLDNDRIATASRKIVVKRK